ncbi:hypothetical protein HDA30_000395 [Micrococcus cohnii]|uniref:Uncharacterized protein n=1 Tax=Micrococcus cohnii TaxID=993416 RepID=A0A7W7GML8_9MICC|nr:hypothetical protein [Micrococcus cohnii]MBB4734887.1 hypothetical protein [Micrococcus cohnii]
MPWVNGQWVDEQPEASVSVPSAPARTPSDVEGAADLLEGILAALPADESDPVDVRLRARLYGYVEGVRAGAGQ